MRIQRWCRSVATAMLLAGGAGLACTHRAAQNAVSPTDCSRIYPASALPLSTETVRDMVGQFRIVVVDTTIRMSFTRAERIPLRLADSLERAASKRRVIGHTPRRDLELVDARLPQPDTAAYDDGYPEVDAGVLFLGGRDHYDGVRDMLSVAAVAKSGFWGAWREDGGIGRRVDDKRRWLPDPAGYFCATRLN